MSGHRGNRYRGTAPPNARGTHPQATSTYSVSLVNVSGPRSRRLIPVWIDPDHLNDLQEAIRLLCQPAHRQPTPEPQDEVILDTGNLQLLLRHLGHPNHQQLQAEIPADLFQDGSDQISEDQDLAAMFSHLSTSATFYESPSRPPAVSRSTVTSPNRPPAASRSAISSPPGARVTVQTRNTPITAPLSVRPTPITVGMSHSLFRRKKYYVVVVGKCTGIYFDSWENIQPIVFHVPGAIHQSFSTYDEAAEFYLDAKRDGRVRHSRNPGDQNIFGPDEDAVQ